MLLLWKVGLGGGSRRMCRRLRHLLFALLADADDGVLRDLVDVE